jgi:hypothetical protein
MKRRYKILLLPTFVLLTVSAYSTFALLAKENPLSMSRAKKTVLTSAPIKKRSIASVQSEQTLKFDCTKETQSAKVYTPQVFIKFENCPAVAKIQQLKLMNETNKYAAQMFRPQSNLIATDYIQLSKGENILKFEISLNDKQKKTQIIKIDRQSTEIQ